MATVVTTQSYDDEVANSSIPVMIDFYADWCGPCQQIMPTIEALAGDYDGKVKIVKVDVDASPELAEKYGVMSIPTLVFVKGGEEVDRLNGAASRGVLEEKLDALA